MTNNLLVLVLLLGVAAYLWITFAGKTPGAEARRLVSTGALLLDVRTPEEFAEGHIQGALNVPVGELPERLSDLGSGDRPIVVYCRSGARSGRAKRLLEKRGFTSVHDLGAMARFDD